MITDRYASELVDLARSGLPLAQALVRFEQIFDAYMIEASGSFAEKRKALLDAFRAKAPETPLAWPIIDKLGGLPEQADEA